MGRIKSAWEIALERSESIKIDKNELQRKDLLKKGKAIAGVYINDIELEVSSVLEKLEKFSDKDLPLVKQGIIDTIYNNIKLPRDKFYESGLNHLSALGIALAKDEQAQISFDNIMKLYNSYSDSQEELLKRLKEQYGAMLQQQNPNVPLEKNPEFIKVVEDNFQSLNQQANEMLDNFITELKQVL